VAVRLNQGGLTPPVKMVEQIVRWVPIPAHIMLRENSGFALKGRKGIEKIKGDARDMAKLGIGGLITGYVQAGKLDLEALREITEAAPSTPFTIHNAIEFTNNPLEALRSLREFPSVDRVFVTGGRGSLWDRIERLPSYQEAFGPGRLLVLGNLKLQDLKLAHHSTDIQTFHIGLAARTPPSASGAVDVRKVREARRLLSQ
jgi:copper homeostasis protein